MRDRGIAPGLLVASPDLRDENFTRTVVLMIRHDDESSFGLVVNRPSGRSLSDANAGLDLTSETHAAAPIFCGGPVPAQEGEPLGFVLHYRASREGDPSALSLEPVATTPEIAGTPEIAAAPEEGLCEELDEACEGIALYTVPLDASALRTLETEPAARLRFITGSARWAPGQLETELLYGAWLVADADPSIIFDTPVEQIWEAAVRSLGIDPATLLPGSLVASPVIH